MSRDRERVVVRYSSAMRFVYLFLLPLPIIVLIATLGESPLQVPLLVGVVAVWVFRTMQVSLILDDDRVIDRRLLTTRTFRYVDIASVEMVEWTAWSKFGTGSNGRQLRVRLRNGQRHSLGSVAGQDEESTTSDHRLDSFQRALEVKLGGRPAPAG